MGDWGQRPPPCPKLSHSLRQDNQRRHLNSQSPALDLSSRRMVAVLCCQCAGHMGVLGLVVEVTGL